jgi:hypothetical protein
VRPDACTCPSRQAGEDDKLKGVRTVTTVETPVAVPRTTRYEYRVIDTGSDVESKLNALGAEGWQVVGVTTKKQLFIAPPQAIILMREVAEGS